MKGAFKEKIPAFQKHDKKKMKLFQSRKKESKVFLDKNFIFESKYINKKTHIYLQNVKELSPPLKNVQLRIRTQQRMNLIVIFLIIANKHDFLNEVTIASYTFNKEAFSILFQMVKNGKIGKLNLLLAPFFKIRQAEYYEYQKKIARMTDNIHLTYAHSHLKITLIRSGDNYYQFEGSMNYSSNQMAEQLLIENNKYIYDKDYFFLNEILKNRKNKALEFVC